LLDPLGQRCLPSERPHVPKIKKSAAKAAKLAAAAAAGASVSVSGGGVSGDKQAASQLHAQCLSIMQKFQERFKQATNNEDTIDANGVRKSSNAVPTDGYFGLSHPTV
jgi:hypothetical protein